jgi:hypothetical protein
LCFLLLERGSEYKTGLRKLSGIDYQLQKFNCQHK